MLLSASHLGRHSRGMRVAAATLLAALLVAAAAMVVTAIHGAHPGESAPPSVVSRSADSGLPGPVAGPQATGIPASTSGAAAATGLAPDAAPSPDQFARAFAIGLLSQDFRTPRPSLLSWVQAHSAVSPEPLVMGLIPPSTRPTWAVTSVTDSSGGTAAVPDQGEWDRLGAVSGYQSVDIQRVSEPYAWVAAVAAGRITDPGVTAREVVAVVTRHTTEAGQPRTVRSSVVLDVNLEGPPTRDTWAFVTLVTYTSIETP